MSDIRSRKLLMSAVAAVCISIVGLTALLPAYIESGRFDPEAWWGTAKEVVMGIGGEGAEGGAEEEEGEDGAMKDKPPASAAQQELAKTLLTFALTASQSTQIVETVRSIRSTVLSHAQVKVSRVATVGVTGESQTFAVSGVAQSRGVLLEVVKSFKKDPQFIKVDMPVSQLSGRDNVFPFTISLSRASLKKEEDSKK